MDVDDPPSHFLRYSAPQFRSSMRRSVCAGALRRPVEPPDDVFFCAVEQAVVAVEIVMVSLVLSLASPSITVVVAEGELDIGY